MLEVSDVFRRFGADYLNAHGASMLPSHRRAIEDILDCRTAALGGQVWRCDACNAEVFSYHSCGNRSCPKCHTAQTRQWLEHRQAEMLPVPYFHITVTVPAELRAILRAHQRDGYAVLMRATACAIMELARDPRYVGGTVAVLAVLHTWDQQLNFHPHTHCLVSGGGISRDGTTWHPARRNFLLPVKALARKVRGKFRVLLQRACPDLVTPDLVWRKNWIAHVTAWGRGEQAVLDYLARYVFRVAITNTRSSASMTPPSASNIATARPATGAPAGSAARSSCAGSSSTCCRAASTKCATSGFGIRHTARMPPGCGRCSNCRRHFGPTRYGNRRVRRLIQLRRQPRSQLNRARALTVTTDA